MATDNTYTNSVPLGQAGTGSAFLLGESQAANRYLQEQDYQRRLAEQQRQRDAQQLAQDWQRNALKVEGGLYWNNEFNNRINDHIQKGIQLRNMGVNPYGYNIDPNAQKAQEEYALERAALESDMGARKTLETELKNRFALLKANPDKYDPQSIAELNNVVSGDFRNALNGGLPNLQERYNPLAVVQKVTPSQSTTERVVGNQRIKSTGINKDETLNSIQSALAADPQSQRWVSQLTGGYTIPQLQRIPNTLEGIKTSLTRQYDGNPVLREELARQGITNKNSAQYRDFVNAEANKLFGAKQRWNDELENLYQTQYGKVKSVDSVINDFSARNMQLREQANARAQTRFNERGQDDVDEDVYYTNEFMDRVFSGARGEQEGTGSGEQLGSILDGKGFQTTWTLPNGKVKRGATYHVEKLVDKNNNPTGKIRIITAPRKTTYTNSDGDEVTKTIPSKNLVIDGNNEAQDRSKLNSFLKDVTDGSLGLKESQIRTNQASGKIKGAQTTKTSTPQKSTTRSAIKSLVGKKGYEGYTEKELIDYYKSQGYNIK